MQRNNGEGMDQDEKYEEGMWWMVKGGDGFDDYFDSISELKEHLEEDEGLAEEKLEYGWVLWREQEQTHKMKELLRKIASDSCFSYHYVVQLWAVVEADGRRYLRTSDQPFSIGNLTKGLCWYRKACMDHVYCVEEGADERRMGGVGRAYRSKHPESTPDLRFYSIDEFPLVHQAARCRLRDYLALPLFDVRSNECYGVLELISGALIGAYQLSALDAAVQSAGLRSTHINFIPIIRSIIMPDKYREQPANEITEILELAIKEVPQLHLAQVWVRCKQCANMRCMERISFINAWDKMVNLCNDIDEDLLLYLQACEFHNLQVDHQHFHQNICNLAIDKNPLAHHANKARLFFCFPISLHSVHNGGDPCVIEFFLQQKSSTDSHSPLHCLLRIIQRKLKSFKLASREQLPRELLVQSRHSDSIAYETTDMLNMINCYVESFSESDFIKYLETSDSCHLRPCPEDKDSKNGWFFCATASDELSESGIDMTQTLYKEKVKHCVKKIAMEIGMQYSIVQFWAPNTVEGRCYLQTSDEPYAFGHLVRDLASFRKKCMKHHYFVDEEAKEEELGPPGRVFRNGYLEITPDLFLYSEIEFPLKNYTFDCSLQEYFALPVFDKQSRECVGVLELFGISYYKYKGIIRRALEENSLCSTHIDFLPSFLRNDITTNCKELALKEMRETFHLISHIPQLHMAKVLVPHEKCDGLPNVKCMELALSTKEGFYLWEDMPMKQPYWIHVHPGKGIIGMLLESESKACFCQNLCEFTIVDQPRAHYERRERLDVCFAICLQSSHTGDLLYVLEFFLNQSPQHLVSFLNFLLPIMTQLLSSFKYACGKQLGEELVVEVIDFSEPSIDPLSELGHSDVFPIKFKRRAYRQKEHQLAEVEPVQCVSDATQTEQSNITSTLGLKKTKRPKRKPGFHLIFEEIKTHFGKKLQDVAEELGVGRSTIKRICRDNGIPRWPRKQNHVKNPSLYETEDDIQDSEQVISTSSSRNLPRLKQKERSKHEGEEKVMVKVKYEEDTIRFEMCLSSGVTELIEEVAAGLNLKIGTFKLKYLDEDDEEILLTRDADLHLCPKSHTTTSKSCIRLFVQLVSK